MGKRSKENDLKMGYSKTHKAMEYIRKTQLMILNCLNT